MIKFLKSKLFRVRVTSCDPDYEGSISIGWDLMEAAGLRPYESVLINNQENGASWETYVIAGDPSECSLRGGAALGLDAKKGDALVVLAWSYSDDFTRIKPKIVRLDHVNRIEGEAHSAGYKAPMPQSLSEAASLANLPQSLGGLGPFGIPVTVDPNANEGEIKIEKGPTYRPPPFAGLPGSLGDVIADGLTKKDDQ